MGRNVHSQNPPNQGGLPEIQNQMMPPQQNVPGEQNIPQQNPITTQPSQMPMPVNTQGGTPVAPKMGMMQDDRYREKMYQQAYPNYQQENMVNPQYMPQDISIGDGVEKKASFYSFLMSDIKYISILFALFFLVQYGYVQDIFYNLSRMMKIPDNFIFTFTKIIISLVATIIIIVSQIYL